MNDIHLDPALRHDAVYLFDAMDCNPNGDPDGGNAPRTDMETGHGLVTDVSLKRRIRDTLTVLNADDDRYRLFVTAGQPLNDPIDAARAQVSIKGKATPEQAQEARAWLCARYVDIRLFGGVLSTGKDEDGTATGGVGKIRGPLQVGFARSVDPVTPNEHAITRVAPTTRKALEDGKVTEMGAKWTIPYGLYVARLHYAGLRGQQTGVTSEDLAALWTALTVMWDHTVAAARVGIAPRGLYVYTHDNAVGRTPAHRLVEQIRVQRRDQPPARRFSDYTVTVPAADELPADVILTTVYTD